MSRPSTPLQGQKELLQPHTQPFPRRPEGAHTQEGTLLIAILCHSEGGWVTAAQEVNSRQPEKESLLYVSLGQLPFLALRMWLTVDPILASAHTTPTSGVS